jgi:Tol biopolymer transport system component
MMVLGLAWALLGCATSREITITSKPADALLNIDGTDRGQGPVTEKFSFSSSDDVHHVTARRLGYMDEAVPLTSQYDQSELVIEMHPRTKRVAVHVTPVPGMVTLDGKPQGDSPVEDIQLTLPFTVDEKNQSITHVIQVNRPGYQQAEQTVKWEDIAGEVTLAMDLMRKDLLIRTTPPGAVVMIGDKAMGQSPIEAHDFPFPPDPTTGQIAAQTVTVSKAGYDPVQTKIEWDNGRREYEVALVAKSKTVHFATDPPGAEVKVDGHMLELGTEGVSMGRLTFPPVDDKGTLKTYEVLITKKAADTEWAPQELTIGWDGGKSDYSITLSEVKTRPVDLLRAKAVRGDNGWQLVPEIIHTLGMKDVSEGAANEPPVRITELPSGTTIDSVVQSPDGQWLAFSVLSGTSKDNFHSQIEMVKADGSAGPNLFGDGKSLDLTPSFTADGSQIVFASNRGGRHISIWQMAANGEGGITQLTSGDSTDLFPTVDSDPKPRLYYESLVDTRPDPRLYMTQLGTTLRTDLTQAGGEQPRVSPRADAVAFTAINAKTGKREIFKMSDRGGAPINLTNNPDADSFDPVWSNDGNRIAFVSDRGADSDNHNNFDIWILDVRHPDKPVRVTTNGSWDDCPAWAPGGKAIYFRSNRGGSWQIWRVAMK